MLRETWSGKLSTNLCLFMLLAGAAAVGCGGETDDSAALPTSQAGEAMKAKNGKKGAQHKEVVILHTTDLHDHLMGWGPNADYSPATVGDDSTVGGFARLAARVTQERTAAGASPVLLLDSGDFTMGSLFTWLNTQAAPALSLMQHMGYDAIALGNHEYDWTPDGLAGTIFAAVQGGVWVPLLASNIVFSAASGDDNLEALQQAGYIRGKLVKTLSNGVKVGIFGLLGDGAQRDTALAAPVTFSGAAAAAASMVSELRQQDGVDLVICLSHSGMDGPDSGEDFDLANAVKGIDVIISGHSHLALAKPVRTNKTIIVQSGDRGRYLGKLVLKLVGNAVVAKKHALIPLDDSVAGDATVQAMVNGYIGALNGALSPMGLGYSAVLAEAAFDLDFPAYMEAPLGDLVTDAYRATVAALQPGEAVDLAVESGGIIRDAIKRGKTGKIWLADLYRALPLGIGTDMVPGFGLVSFYINGAEVKQGMELTAAAKDVLGSNDFFMQVSGVEMQYSPAAPPFNRVSSVKVGGQPVDTAGCYKMVTNYYVAMLLSMLKYLTFGAVSITPKEAGCAAPVADLDARIVDRDPATPGIQQLKQWQALVSTVSSFPDQDSDGIPDIPAAYAAPQGRITAR